MAIVLSKPGPQITTCDKAVVKTRPIGGHTDDARHVGDGSLDSVNIGIDVERSFALGRSEMTNANGCKNADLPKKERRPDGSASI